MWTDRDTLILMGFWMFPALCVVGGMLAYWLRGHPFCRHDCNNRPELHTANDRLHRPTEAAAEGGTVRGEVGT